MAKRKIDTNKGAGKCPDYTSETETDPDLDIFEDSSVICPVKKRVQKLVSDESDTNDEENIRNQLSEQWIWQTKNNQPKIWKYTETPGIKVTSTGDLNDNSGKLDFFYAIFDKKFWEIVVTETNCYAEQCISDERRKRKIDETWLPVNCDEMKVYFALCIIMTQVRKTNIQMNWTKRAIIETPIFRKTMPYTRFLQITRFLQFANNNTTDNYDQLSKIDPVATFFNQKFKEVYIMEEDISIDESLMKFKGRLSYKQNKPSKRARFGIKFYKLCESASGYCYHFKIYTGNGTINHDDSASENVVMELISSVLHKGHTLYLDNRFSSPKLFLRLIKNKTNAIGRVGSNRKNMPIDLMKKKLKKGECEMRSSNGIFALNWKDKRDVHVLSTKHDKIEMAEERKPDILKPKCIIDYNKGMIGVDRQDQMLACFPIMRKHMKEYRKFFFYIFDMALYNTNILYKKIHKEKLTYAEYRVGIAELLLKTAQSNYNRTEQIPIGDTPERLQGRNWGHFPKHIDPTLSKQKPARTCKVCAKHKKRSETTWECKKCKVALHVPDCFEKYHTLENF